jgi:hypothetical protein
MPRQRAQSIALVALVFFWAQEFELKFLMRSATIQIPSFDLIKPRQRTLMKRSCLGSLLVYHLLKHRMAFL